MGLVRATHRFARISPSKVHQFANLIRGRTAGDGLNQLKYIPNRGARLLERVLQSAIANAAEMKVRNVERLRIVEARVDCGPTMKRIQPRSRGMAMVILRRMSHLHVAIEVPELS